MPRYLSAHAPLSITPQVSRELELDIFPRFKESEAGMAAAVEARRPAPSPNPV